MIAFLLFLVSLLLSNANVRGGYSVLQKRELRRGGGGVGRGGLSRIRTSEFINSGDRRKMDP